MTATLDDDVVDVRRANAELQRRLNEALAERDESLQRETATAEVLQVINASPGDLAPVFDAMLEKGLRLCDAAFGMLWTYDGEVWEAVALRQVPPDYAAFLGGGPHRPTAGTAHGRISRGEHLVHIADVAAEELYRAGDDPHRSRLVELAGARTFLVVPMRNDEKLLGAFSLYRREVRPFTDKQIALLQNFAAQAVIAMENARLLTETREALEQQTATAEVLQVINSSPGDLAPVFDAMLDKAMRLCDVKNGYFYIYDGERLHPRAIRGEPQFVNLLRERGPQPIGPGSPLDRAFRAERVVHIIDALQEEAYRTSPDFKKLIDVGCIRTGVVLPLHRGSIFLGSIHLFRQEVRPFTEKQIALLENFAAQAVIAMENARLLTETREALEQQTATAEVLQVINSSPGDLAPVFDAIVEKAHTLCDAASGSLQLWDGEKFRGVAMRGVSEAMAERQRLGYSPSDMPCQRIVEGERVAHCADLAEIDNPTARTGVELGGVRTILYVALRKDDILLGQIVAFRQEVRPFAEKEIALLENFAAQAVIAMESARLLTETREALEQQTATAEVLQVINSSPGDLKPVFDAILEKAKHLCETAFGMLQTYDGERFHLAAFNAPPFANKAIYLGPQAPEPGGLLARHVAGEDRIHIPDLAADRELYEVHPRRRFLVDDLGIRTHLSLSLRKDGVLLVPYQLSVCKV
jgi:GAF domain-containing protein